MVLTFLLHAPVCVPSTSYSSVHHGLHVQLKDNALQCYAHEWIKKMWHIDTMEYYLAIKRNSCESVLLRRMKLAPVIQSEVSQKEKNKYRILTHIYGIQKDGTDEPIYTTEATQQQQQQQWRQRCREQTMAMGSVGREEADGGTSGESSMETYALQNIKQIANGNLLYDSENSNQCFATTQRSGKGWDVGGRFKRKGIYVYL